MRLLPPLAPYSTQCHSKTEARAFKTRVFARFARDAELSDADLLVAIAEMDRGLIDAKLAPYLFKKRVALGGRGKSGGARMIVAAKMGEVYFLLYGFKKNDRDNIDASELRSFLKAAVRSVELSNTEIETLLECGELQEVTCGSKSR